MLQPAAHAGFVVNLREERGGEGKENPGWFARCRKERVGNEVMWRVFHIGGGGKTSKVV